MTNSEINEFLGEFDNNQEDLINRLEDLRQTMEVAMQPLLKPVLKANYTKQKLISGVLSANCHMTYIQKLILVYMIHKHDKDKSLSVQSIIDATGISSASVKRAIRALKGIIIRHPHMTGYTVDLLKL